MEVAVHDLGHLVVRDLEQILVRRAALGERTPCHVAGRRRRRCGRRWLSSTLVVTLAVVALAGAVHVERGVSSS
jgi:hypothetical protein